MLVYKMLLKWIDLDSVNGEEGIALSGLRGFRITAAASCSLVKYLQQASSAMSNRIPLVFKHAMI